MSGDGLQSGVSATRGWGWVFAGGVVAALLATYSSLGGGVWWLFTGAVAFVWELPYVPVIAASLALLAGLVFAIWQLLRRRHD